MVKKSFDERWPRDSAYEVGGVPWKTSDDDEDADGPALKGKAEANDPEQPKVDEELKGIPEAELPPRRFTIFKKDLETYGYTKGCRGCTTAVRGMTMQPHNDECRDRIGKAMIEGGQSKIKKAEQRANEWAAKKIDEDVKKRAREAKAEEERTRDTNSGQAQSTNPEARSSTENQEAETPSKKRRGCENMGGTSADQDDAQNLCSQTPKRTIEHEADPDPPARRRKTGTDEDEEVLAVMKAKQERPVNRQELPWSEEIERAYDEVTGEELDLKKVRESRAEEVEFLITRGIWEKAPISECWQVTGEKPTSVKWVDVKKRSRLVARDFKPKGEKSRPDIFASMPPLAAKKLLFSMAASQEGKARKMTLMFIDIKKAHLNGKCEEPAYVELPSEVPHETDECGRLLFWLYGMRPAARAWEEDYATRLLAIGFRRGKASATTFTNDETGIRIVVHGDDFTLLGYEEDLKALAELMKTWYELVVRGMLGRTNETIKKSESLIVPSGGSWKESE